MAVAAHFGREGRIVVGKDTRRSCYMFENALASGLCAQGADVMLVGPMPTPAIAYLAQSMRADAGVVISASHNPYEDNGIKLFAADGFKLPDEVELQLEALMVEGALDHSLKTGSAIGQVARIDDAGGRYITHVKQAFPNRCKLDGVRLVIDCAHGAAYKIAPTVLRELGADVIAVGVSPDGLNINQGVGAMHPEHLAGLVRQYRADLGIALDGDADRAVFCDSAGNVVDGDVVLAIIGRELARQGALPGNVVVSTVMSNLGLERSLAEVGVELARTPVGDRYVVETMRRRGAVLGGEQSGHTICLQHSTTGDGVMAALQVLGVMVQRDRSLAELASVMTRFPQVSRSFAVSTKRPLEEMPKLRAEISAVEAALGSEGRVLVRYSGTESKLRVMVEGTERHSLTAMVDRLGAIAVAELLN